MEEKDQFHAIAVSSDVVLKSVPDLPQLPPRTYTHVDVPETSLTNIAVPHPSEEEQYQHFLQEKAALRAHYEPFLQELYTKKVAPGFVQELVDFDYRKETAEDRADFANVLGYRGNWEAVKLPHYVGPAGRWNAYYYTTLTVQEIRKDRRYLLRFEAVDYVATIYLNGRMVKEHEGFFAPFYIDVTDYLHEGDNTLVVQVHDDYVTQGSIVNGLTNVGPKIYAATSFGYNDPYDGWHHCPPGAGIVGKVTFEERPLYRIEDIYVRPDIDKGEVYVRTEIINGTNTSEKEKVFSLGLTLEGRNFKETVFTDKKQKLERLEIDENWIESTFSIPNFRLWTQNEPYLYELTVDLYDENGNLVDTAHQHIGMRQFSMDENSKPYKGAFYLNHERIILRGANEMGHFPRAVMEHHDEHIIDDILTAKVAHLNFYRLTQRPVFEKIYTYFDMMGMLMQGDFPFFGSITYRCLPEAYKQVVEMERLTRSHPCVVVETLCNEFFDAQETGRKQYSINRYQAEDFFEAAQKIIHLENPDRVLKLNEGDYAPLPNTWGVSDFHCYTLWYIAHAMDAGRMNKGYLPGVNAEWYTSCGEYGVDGLDSYEIMKKYAPKDWLPKNINDEWYPNVIAKGQCFNLLPGFVMEQEHILDWIRVSRAYQKDAIKQYVHMLRRRTDRIESTAVHLLIDAWPMGWTKALVDVDRIPKPAYYAFQEANIPFRVSLRRDRYSLYAGEAAKVEVYLLNDCPMVKKGKLVATVYQNDKAVASFGKDVMADPCNETYVGDVNWKSEEGELVIKAQLISDDPHDEVTYDEVNYAIAPALKPTPTRPRILGDAAKPLEVLFSGETNSKVVFTDDKYYFNHRQEIETMVKEGKRVVLFFENPIHVFDDDVPLWKHPNPGNNMASNYLHINPESPLCEGIGLEEFKNLYNKDRDYQDISAWYKYFWKDSTPILYMPINQEMPDKNHLGKKEVVALKRFGKGELILSTLSNIAGFVGENPVFDRLIQNLATKGLI